MSEVGFGSSNISGVWILQSTESKNVETGEVLPFPDAKGVLILHPDGRMLALITPAKQEAAVSETQQASIYRFTSAYSGRYKIEGANRFITLVDCSIWHSWLGTEQARTYSLIGEKLEIVTDPTPLPAMPNILTQVKLTWVRDDGAMHP